MGGAAAAIGGESVTFAEVETLGYLPDLTLEEHWVRSWTKHS